MAQQINDNYRLHAPKLLDDRSGPFDSVAEALLEIPEYQREIGLEVVVIVGGVQKKYWFKDGIEDLDFVEMAGGGGGGTTHYIAATPPSTATASAGQTWTDTTTARTYELWEDGLLKYWIERTNNKIILE